MNKLLTEFIGTFFLVITVALCVKQGVPYAPVVIGSVLMCMVYMGGHVSGAHYNPAVTLAVWLRGKIGPVDAAKYMLVQLLGAVAAAAVAYLLMSSRIVSTDAATGTVTKVVTHDWLLVAPGPNRLPFVLAAEVLFTFALALVVLNVATVRATAGNSYYGLAIGFTVAVGAACVGAISGGAFNPAVGVGANLFAAVMGDPVGHSWIYVVGPCVGSALAAVVFKLQHGADADRG
jgi:aquaporin Z